MDASSALFCLRIYLLTTKTLLTAFLNMYPLKIATKATIKNQIRIIDTMRDSLKMRLLKAVKNKKAQEILYLEKDKDSQIKLGKMTSKYKNY